MATKMTKPVKKTVTKAKAEKPTVKSAAAKRGAGLPVFDAKGKADGSVVPSESLFGAKVNDVLLAQSVRVYLANQRAGSAKTKTRGEVEGSTRKIYKQKGTGKARHGSIRAPIFVGGGIVFGPVPHDFHLKLSKSMKRAALVSALSAKRADTIVMDGLETVEPKTKLVASALAAAGCSGTVLLVVPKGASALVRASRNIDGLESIPATDLHPYTILMHKTIVFTKKSLEESTAFFTK